ncbi:hypothetical protein SAV31267_003580 [Streptomyces avermitilis]|uniref:Uncharacterized protein n=1 Tax=Streptomyces avermitilis TaxID=33903 RepID=A0A4D4MFV1_STRAX|nr:hypothetical protein SAV31267_003580 [Streptomyces avermitilis]
MAVQQHHRRPFSAVANENRCFIDLNPPGLKVLEQDPNLQPSLTPRPLHLSAQDNPALAREDHRADRLRKLDSSSEPTQPSSCPASAVDTTAQFANGVAAMPGTGQLPRRGLAEPD